MPPASSAKNALKSSPRWPTGSYFATPGAQSVSMLSIILMNICFSSRQLVLQQEVMSTGPSSAADANRIAVAIVRAHQARELIKIKSMTTEEIDLNQALEAAGIHPVETDLAELIIQLGHDKPSHIIAPALHKNRHQVREIFIREMKLKELGDTAEDLTAAARRYLREKFLRVKVAVSGANFLVAETGSVCIVESEGNGRMCLTLPQAHDRRGRHREGRAPLPGP